jgi:nitric oxide reductase NorD protein
MLQKKRKGALWARDFFMRPTSGDFETRKVYKPFIQDYFMHLPDAFEGFEGVPGLDLYRATAAHCAAHLVYTKVSISAETLNPLQMAVIRQIR